MNLARLAWLLAGLAGAGALRATGSSGFLVDLSAAISRATGSEFSGNRLCGGTGGGGGATTGFIVDSARGREYFYKSAGLGAYAMLLGEFEGVLDMQATHTVRVPRPIAVGTSEYTCFAVFEKISMGGTGSEEEYARNLAAMHRCTSANGQFGYRLNNTIGATFQPNPWTHNWADFWDTHRLGHMFALCRAGGARFPHEGRVRDKVHALLSAHSCPPSLLHGDLWSGNQAFSAEGHAVIFDPATYYGDREVDVAMTRLFGSNSAAFYAAYAEEWPLPPGWELRQSVYNSYHLLNHHLLFGGGYLQQASRMLERVLLADEASDET